MRMAPGEDERPKSGVIEPVRKLAPDHPALQSRAAAGDHFDRPKAFARCAMQEFFDQRCGFRRRKPMQVEAQRRAHPAGRKAPPTRPVKTGRGRSDHERGLNGWSLGTWPRCRSPACRALRHRAGSRRGRNRCPRRPVSSARHDAGRERSPCRAVLGVLLRFSGWCARRHHPQPARHAADVARARRVQASARYRRSAKARSPASRCAA